MNLSRWVALGLILLVAGCSQPQTNQAAAARTTIRFATDWRAQAEHGGFYQALATGEYARRGLDVRIIQGGPNVNVPQMIAAGSVELGMGSNSFIVMNLANEGVPVRAVAAFMQKDPQVLIAHPNAGINRIADMRGHPILLSEASLTAFWVWLRARYGFSDSQVRRYTFSSAPFLADRRVVQQGYLTSEPYTIQREAGFAPRVFLLADEGYPSYATMVLAHNRMIASNPAAIRAFNEATAAGWRSYLHGDAAPADRMILRDNPEMTQDLLNQARDRMRQYSIVEAPGVPIGAMTDARWREFFTIAQQQRVYPASLDYRRAFTLDLLPAGPPAPAAPAPAGDAAAPASAPAH